MLDGQLFRGLFWSSVAATEGSNFWKQTLRDALHRDVKAAGVARLAWYAAIRNSNRGWSGLDSRSTASRSSRDFSRGLDVEMVEDWDRDRREGSVAPRGLAAASLGAEDEDQPPAVRSPQRKASVIPDSVHQVRNIARRSWLSLQRGCQSVHESVDLNYRVNTGWPQSESCIRGLTLGKRFALPKPRGATPRVW
jgi:hypothetical protein